MEANEALVIAIYGLNIDYVSSCSAELLAVLLIFAIFVRSETIRTVTVLLQFAGFDIECNYTFLVVAITAAYHDV